MIEHQMALGGAEGERIRLRPCRLGDIDDVFCGWYQNADGHLDYFTGSGRSFDHAELIRDYQQGLESGGRYYYIIETFDAHRIGTVKIGPIDRRNRTSDLVCLIGDRAFLGRGLASEAIGLANAIAFEQHGIRRLHGGMYASNAASIKAYIRAGWFVEATLRGYYLVDGRPVDRVCVACLNPRDFADPRAQP